MLINTLRSAGRTGSLEGLTEPVAGVRPGATTAVKAAVRAPVVPEDLEDKAGPKAAAEIAFPIRAVAKPARRVKLRCPSVRSRLPHRQTSI